MESLTFKYTEGTKSYDVPAVVVGVVSSGNLEVLIEQSDKNVCTCNIVTSEAGYKNIWECVINDFFSKHELTHANVYVNDSGASPSVVSLRLDQAIEKFKGNIND